MSNNGNQWGNGPPPSGGYAPPPHPQQGGYGPPPSGPMQPHQHQYPPQHHGYPHPGPYQGPPPGYYPPPQMQQVVVVQQNAMVFKPPFNHGLHLIICFFTCGAWIPIWLICWAVH